MDIYSITLLIAIALLVVATSIFVFARLKNSVQAVRISAFTSVAAMLADLFSLTFHRFVDHAAGGPNALGSLDFVAQHPAFIFVGVFSSLLFWLSFRRASLIE